jgi:hypothetical protein
MKNLLLVIAIVTIFLLAACTGNTSTPSLTNADQVATIVAATLSAIPSPSPMPTERLTPTPTISLTAQWLTWPPYLRKEQAQYLFQADFDSSQWEVKNNTTQNVYGLKRFEQYLLNRQIPECAIIQTVGSGALSPEYSLEDGQKNINGIVFNTKSVKLNAKLVFVIYSTALNLDNSYHNIFVVGGSDDCLASGEQVLSTLKAVNVEKITPSP